MKASILFVVATVLGSVSADEVKFGFPGKCPKVPMVDVFNSKSFMSKWYAIKQTGKFSRCLSYDLKEVHDGHYHADVSPKKLVIEFDKVDDNFAEGLNVKFPVNPFMDGGRAFIFATDYENYGGIFICKEDIEKDIHYQTISYWSKTPTLSDEYFKILDDSLAKYPEIDISKLIGVEHDVCEVVPPVEA